MGESEPKLTAYDVMQDLRAKLEAIASDPDPYYWVGGHDQGDDYCFECCEARVAELRAKDPDAQVFVDGGWMRESESSRVCAGCGALLGYTLTDYGMADELAYFEGTLFDADHRLTPDSAYQLARVCGAMIPDSPEIERVIAVCKDALRFLPDLARRAIKASTHKETIE